MVVKELIDKLRSTQSVSKRALLDEAADVIEALLADLKNIAYDCACCVHAGKTRPCENTDYMCVECPFECVCKTCRDNSNWEWRGIRDAARGSG